MKELMMKKIFHKSFLIFSLLIIIVFINNKIYKISKNPTDIPELLNYENQTLNLLVLKNECKYISPVTIFFNAEFRYLNRSDNYELRKINLKDKNYFVTYYLNDNYFYSQYLSLLKDNGLIRSKNIKGNNNLFFGPISKIPSNKNIDKGTNFNKYQKIEGYLSGRHYFHKNSLYIYYKYMKKLFYEDFNYMPETYIFPEDKEIIENKFKNYHLNSNDLWLIKPVDKSEGSGIFILSSLKEIKMKNYVITRYISDISLINGRKYDLRLYILISGLKPLRIYLYKEGLVRIAIEKYKLAINSINNKYMHITNTALNIKKHKFIIPNNTNDENANMWNLFMYKRYLRKNKIEWHELLQKIKDIIIMFKRNISLIYKILYKRNYINNKFYEEK